MTIVDPYAQVLQEQVAKTKQQPRLNLENLENGTAPKMLYSSLTADSRPDTARSNYCNGSMVVSYYFNNYTAQSLYIADSSSSFVIGPSPTNHLPADDTKYIGSLKITKKIQFKNEQNYLDSFAMLSRLELADSPKTLMGEAAVIKRWMDYYEKDDTSGNFRSSFDVYIHYGVKIKDLSDEIAIFIPECNIVISTQPYGILNHPNERAGTFKQEVVNHRFKNGGLSGTFVRIIDTHGFNERYYFHAFGKVHEIVPIKTKKEKDGIYMGETNDKGNLVFREPISLEDAEKHGIYFTYRDAELNGTSEASLRVKELELRNSHLNSQAEVYSAKSQMEVSKMENTITIEQMHMELAERERLFKLEMAEQERKHKLELLKIERKLRKRDKKEERNFKREDHVLKLKHEHKAAKLKAELDETIARQKRELEEAAAKQKREQEEEAFKQKRAQEALADEDRRRREKADARLREEITATNNKIKEEFDRKVNEQKLYYEGRSYDRKDSSEMMKWAPTLVVGALLLTNMASKYSSNT